MQQNGAAPVDILFLNKFFWLTIFAHDTIPVALWLTVRQASFVVQITQYTRQAPHRLNVDHALSHPSLSDLEALRETSCLS